MSWASELEKLNQAVLGEFGIAVTFTPQDGSGPQTITGIILNPTMEEDVIPNLTGGTYVIEDIDIDVSGLEMHGVLRVSDLPHGDKIKFLNAADATVAHVVSIREEAPTAAEAEAAAGAAARLWAR